jgi:hypothetical protein
MLNFKSLKPIEDTAAPRDEGLFRFMPREPDQLLRKNQMRLENKKSARGPAKNGVAPSTMLA